MGKVEKIMKKPFLVKAAYFLYIILFLKDFIYSFLERGEGREKEGQKHQCEVASHVLPTGDLACNPGPKPPSTEQPDQCPCCRRATKPKSTDSEQHLPSPCAQSPAEPTGSQGGRQNTQQRGAAGLGDTAFPGKTPPSRGLNYPIAAPRAPSI